MKKLQGFLIISFICLFLLGCTSTKEEKMVCSLNTNDVVNKYELNATYTVTYVGKIVKNVDNKEIVTSNEQSILDYFENALETSYLTANETYGGYNYTVDRTSNTVTGAVKIDYTIMDLNKFVKDQPSLKSYVNSKNEMTIEGLKSLYTTLGATCK